MPFNLMPKSVKSGVGSSKRKQKRWMDVYEAARRKGKSKSSAAKIAYSAIRKESAGAMSLMSVYESVERSVAENAKQGKMVALFVPPEIGSSLQSVFSDVPGDMVQPEDMHITLGLLNGDSSETNMANSILKDLSKNLDPFDIEISKFGVFEPHEGNEFKHVLYAEPSSSYIKDLHDMIFSTFEKHGLNIDNGHFDFKPHITLKYCDQKPQIDRKIENPIFRIKQLSMADANKKYHYNMRSCEI